MAISLLVACKKYFGMKEGQKLSDFGQEVKSLTTESREEIAQALSEILGEEVTDTVTVK